MSTTTTRPRVTPAPPPRTVVSTLLDRVTDVLAAHSITVLRVSLGLVFLVFGAFKFVSGASPAEDLAVATVDKLTLGVVTGGAALLLTAVMETVIGLTLVTGRFVRVGLVVLATALGGILSPLVLFPDQMWSGNGPTLTGQYVFKDIVLVAAGLVVAAHALGARLRVPREG
jgi:uncharacterized membrane protein YphA (DoxX/SURF4 family)